MLLRLSRTPLFILRFHLEPLSTSSHSSTDNQAPTSTFAEPFTGELQLLERRALQLLEIIVSQWESGAGRTIETKVTGAKAVADQCTDTDTGVVSCTEAIVAVREAKSNGEKVIAARFRERRRQAVDEMRSACRRQIDALDA
jgi:hypothetical protein